MSSPLAQPAPPSPLELEFEAVQRRFPGAVMRSEAGVTTVSVPGVALPEGWSKPATTIHFLVPAGYPYANPDCFNIDDDVRLSSGVLPHAAQLQAMPLVGSTLWFSWHLQRPWKPGRDNLTTWLGVCMRRLEDVR